MLTVLRKWLATHLVMLAVWVAPPPPPCRPWDGEPADPLDVLALELVAHMDASCDPATSGEYKRHRVYAQLLTAFPARPKREIGMAIERAVAK